MPTNPPAPAAKQRPGSVTISSYLLYLVAALQLISFLISLPVIGPINEVYEEAYAGTELADAAGTFGTIGIIFSGVVLLIIAIGLVVLAVLNMKGKNASRIVTWVLGGIFLCCIGIGVVSGLAGGAMGAPGAPTDSNAPDPAEVQRMLEERLPGWFFPVSTALSVISLIAILVALILLALPASNEFFRRPQPVWEPPMPGSPYPGYPPTPPAGGSQPPYPPTGPGGPQPPSPPSAG